MTTSTTIYISVLAVPLYCEVLISLFYSVKRSINLTNTANLILSLTNLFIILASYPERFNKRETVATN